MKRIFISVIVLMLLPSAFAESTKLRSIFEFMDLYNKYIYECRDRYNYDATHELSDTLYMATSGFVITPAGTFFLDSDNNIYYCTFANTTLKGEDETKKYLIRALSAITALEYSVIDTKITQDPIVKVLNSDVYNSIVNITDQQFDELRESGEPQKIASGNYDYSIAYLKDYDEFYLLAERRDA